MKPIDFIKSYEAALGKQDWNAVAPLITEYASVTFSTGQVHMGKAAIKAAFTNNFNIIKSEKYAIENVRWLKKEEQFAVYLFEYSWSGFINGQLMSGSGIGTSVIVKENGQWQLLTEHLGRK